MTSQRGFESALVERAQAGDRAAREQLLVNLEPVLRAFFIKRIGYKPAGGISKAKDALVYLSLIKDELGNRWLQPDLFRFGASSLLGDIERQLEHHVTGRYSAGWRHAIG